MLTQSAVWQVMSHSSEMCTQTIISCNL